MWALCEHVNDAYPPCSVSWFLAPVGDQAFNILFCCVFRFDEVVDGLSRFLGDQSDCWRFLVSGGICSVVSCNICRVCLWVGGMSGLLPVRCDESRARSSR